MGYITVICCKESDKVGHPKNQGGKTSRDLRIGREYSSPFPIPIPPLPPLFRCPIQRYVRRNIHVGVLNSAERDLPVEGIRKYFCLL